MSHRDDADKSPSVPKSGLESVRSRISVRSKKNSSPKAFQSIFRGFPKEPCVAVPRLDLTPYLSTDPAQKSQATKTEQDRLKPILKEPSFDKFSAKCCVNIVRDDLGKLKELIKKNPDLLKNRRLYLPDIMSLKCNICEKIYSSSRKLLNHQKNKHMIIKAKASKRVSFSDKVIVHELKEYHKCRKCPKIFENYKSLKCHMKNQHKKRKCYICNYCMKKFVDRMFFKVHIKLHCESCGQLFTSKTKCMLHKRSVCKILKLHECKTCNLSFFKLMDLKDHSYEHITTCYVCDICKDQCPTKCGIAHHIYFLHSKRIKRRNPTLYITRKLSSESLYLCKFCDESSVDRDVIEQHVQLLPDLNNRVMTGYKDYYFCDQCLKKFDTEKDMLQHKWSHFLKTSDNSQIRAKKNLSNKKAPVKTIYNVNENIPEHFQPSLILEKIKVGGKVLTMTDDIKFVDVNNFDVNHGDIQKAVVDSKSKKTIISKHQCPVGETTSIMAEVNVNQGDHKKPFVGPKSKKTVISKYQSLVGETISTTTDHTNVIDVTTFNINPGDLRKPIVDPLTKKTIMSKHQCSNCGKYYSSNYCLNRHIETQHSDFENLRCKVCEEVFVWPSLLQSHKCIRLQIPEMPFEDARPEIQFDNLHEINMNNYVTTNGDSTEIVTGFDDLNITESDDYMNSVDFEIPAPIVELTEFENSYIHFNNVPNIPNGVNGQINANANKVQPLQNLGYKLVMQEVPIEF